MAEEKKGEYDFPPLNEIPSGGDVSGIDFKRRAAAKLVTVAVVNGFKRSAPVPETAEESKLWSILWNKYTIVLTGALSSSIQTWSNSYGYLYACFVSIFLAVSSQVDLDTITFILDEMIECLTKRKNKKWMSLITKYIPKATLLLANGMVLWKSSSIAEQTMMIYRTFINVQNDLIGVWDLNNQDMATKIGHIVCIMNSASGILSDRSRRLALKLLSGKISKPSLEFIRYFSNEVSGKFWSRFGFENNAHAIRILPTKEEVALSLRQKQQDMFKERIVSYSGGTLTDEHLDDGSWTEGFVAGVTNIFNFVEKVQNRGPVNRYTQTYDRLELFQNDLLKSSEEITSSLSDILLIVFFLILAILTSFYGKRLKRRREVQASNRFEEIESPMRLSPKRKVLKRNSPKRKVLKRNSPKRKVLKRNSPKRKV